MPTASTAPEDRASRESQRLRVGPNDQSLLPTKLIGVTSTMAIAWEAISGNPARTRTYRPEVRDESERGDHQEAHTLVRDVTALVTERPQAVPRVVVGDGDEERADGGRNVVKADYEHEQPEHPQIDDVPRHADEAELDQLLPVPTAAEAARPGARRPTLTSACEVSTAVTRQPGLRFRIPPMRLGIPTLRRRRAARNDTGRSSARGVPPRCARPRRAVDPNVLRAERRASSFDELLVQRGGPRVRPLRLRSRRTALGRERPVTRLPREPRHCRTRLDQGSSCVLRQLGHPLDRHDLGREPASTAA